MNSPCSSTVNCPCDNLAGSGYSAEAGDQVFFMDTEFAAVVPALGNSSYTRLSCQSTQTSPVSLAAAVLQAEQEALLCAEGLASPYNPDTFPLGGQGGGGGSGNPAISPAGGGSQGGSGVIPTPGGGGSSPPGGGGGPAPPQTFYNTPQTATINCPDGTPFSFTCAAALFSGNSQLIADTAAISYANAQVAIRIICLSPLSNLNAVATQPFTSIITASGSQLAVSPNTNTWSVSSGSLPDGLTLQANTPNANQATLTGTPTNPSQTTVFTVTLTDPNGNTQSKTYSLTTTCINSFLVTQNIEYSQPGKQPFQLFLYPNCPTCGTYFSTNSGFGDYVQMTLVFAAAPGKTLNYRFYGTGAYYDGFNSGVYVSVNGSVNTIFPAANGSFDTTVGGNPLTTALNCGGVTIQVYMLNGSPSNTTGFDWNIV